MIFAGIDYSMTCPSIAIGSKEGDQVDFYFRTEKAKFALSFCDKQFNFHGSLAPIWSSPMERFESNASWALQLLVRNNVQKIFLEGYSYGSKNGRAFEIAENTALLKYMVHSVGIQYEPIAPTTVKAFAGSGRADKFMMEQYFYDLTKVDVRGLLGQSAKSTSPSGDIIDSYFLLKCGLNKETASIA